MFSYLTAETADWRLGSGDSNLNHFRGRCSDLKFPGVLYFCSTLSTYGLCPVFSARGEAYLGHNIFQSTVNMSIIISLRFYFKRIKSQRASQLYQMCSSSQHIHTWILTAPNLGYFAQTYKYSWFPHFHSQNGNASEKNESQENAIQT